MKWIIAGLVAVLVIAGGAGAYMMLSEDEQSNSEQAAGSSKTSEGVEENVSIEDLLSRNASLKCTYNVKDGESTNTGTAYFSGGKNMYGEFTNTSKDSSITAYVIRSGDTQYVWQKDSKTGFKANVSASTKEAQQELSQQFDPEKKYKFACENWQKDESLFTPPSSVTFTDISAQTEKLLEQLQN